MEEIGKNFLFLFSHQQSAERKEIVTEVEKKEIDLNFLDSNKSVLRTLITAI